MNSTSPFFSEVVSSRATWQGFERLILRLLILQGFEHTWHVGTSGDGGADLLAVRADKQTHQLKRWLFQVKKYKTSVGVSVLEETLRAAQRYGADVPVIVSAGGFSKTVRDKQRMLMNEGIPLQLWDLSRIEKIGKGLAEEPLATQVGSGLQLRHYQQEAIKRILQRKQEGIDNALVVLATGLGKTVVAGEAVRRLREIGGVSSRVLVLAHTVDLVHQLERSFWPFMSTRDSTYVVTGNEKPQSWSDLERFSFVFASKDSVHIAQQADVFPKIFDIVVVDECHHIGAAIYESVLTNLGVGDVGGPFLIGLTATPWRPGGENLSHRFDDPVVSVDLPTGLRDGYLANVDYRIFTDNVDWERLRNLEGDRFTPEKINRTLFITEWDDSVIERTAETWNELTGVKRGIVFCGTISQAQTISQKINALGFTRAQAIASKKPDGKVLSPIERGKILWDFANGNIGILCAVDVLNEGIDVPDVNLVVFQRVTHSRRIFVQQLGRGLRLKEGKDKVVVLDFVTDIRRFAEGLELGKAVDETGPRPGDARTVKVNHKVKFYRRTDEDLDSVEFLKIWLGDMEAIAGAGDDASVLKFPDISHLPPR
jgi:superfamily II DNA or RNA helicase